MSTTADQALRYPPLDHRMPDCGLCGSETSHDGDTFVCEPCGIWWPDAHGSGEQLDDLVELCEEEIAPFENAVNYPTIVGHRYRCVRPVHHTGDHAGLRCDRNDRPDDTHIWRAS